MYIAMQNECSLTSSIRKTLLTMQYTIQHKVAYTHIRTYLLINNILYIQKVKVFLDFFWLFTIFIKLFQVEDYLAN